MRACSKPLRSLARRRWRHLCSVSGEEYYHQAARSDADLANRAAFEEMVLCDSVTELPVSEDVLIDISRYGVAKLPGCLREDSLITLHAACMEELRNALDHATGYDDGDDRAHFSAVLGASSSPDGECSEEQRWDLRLPLHPCRVALRELLIGPLGTALEALVFDEAELHELAVVISAPGAIPQVVHSDADWSERASIFTAFVALQDVELDMGPTVFLRGTHTAEAHDAFDAQGLRALTRMDARAATLKAGDVSLYDRRLLHTGGRNRSDIARLLFYVTFRRAGADADVDNANSLRHEYRGQLSLRNLRGEL